MNKEFKKDTRKERPSLLSNLQSGAIAIGKQEDILTAIKSDENLKGLTDQTGIIFENVNSATEFTKLAEGTFIIAQKFNLYSGKDDKNPKQIITWCPANYKDLLLLFNITTKPTTDFVDGNDIRIDDNYPSFLGKNIKKVFSKIKEEEYENDPVLKQFINCYIMEDNYTLANTVFYRLYIDNFKFANSPIKYLKAARDKKLSPKNNEYK